MQVRFSLVCISILSISDNSFVIYPLYIIAVLRLLFMVWTALRNPGYLEMNTENEESQSLINEETRKKRQAGIICNECGSRRPLRTYHCSKCYHCVIRYDHHSILLNQCIGYNNQIQYLFFLIFCILMDYICFFIIVRYSKLSVLFSSRSSATLVLTCMFFVAVDTLNSISLSKRFMDNIIMNLTQYEADHYYRIGYLKWLFSLDFTHRDASFRFHNLFFKSTFRSLLEFFHLAGIRWCGFAQSFI